MGHTSKFTFPLPGRKQKASQAPAIISPPLSKAQKLLGASDAGANASAADQHRGHRANSVVSGISICISDSTVSRSEHATGLGIIHDGIGDVGKVHGGSRSRQWEEESGVMPSPSRMRNDGYDDPTTDASSLHRRQSTSTIVSYYDKANLPLSISQQTSASAMAKGLPHKAHALLDMDGTTIPTKPKKKPAKLDLTHLVPRPRFSRLSLASDPQIQKPFVLGPDMVTRSPSVMSISPDASPPLVQQRMERPGRKSARDTLRALLPTVTEGRPTSSRSRNSLHPEVQPQERPTEVGTLSKPSRSSINLHNLYEHYEQVTLQDVMEEEAAPPVPIKPAKPPGPISPNHLPRMRDMSGHSSQQRPTSKGFLSPFAKIAQRGTLSSRQKAPPSSSARSPSPVTIPSTGPDSPARSAASMSQSKSESLDCGASISSRHTRTSKASRRTDRSINDLDLQLNSVLSLSSDSEDDLTEPDGRPSSYGSSRAAAPSRAATNEVKGNQRSKGTAMGAAASGHDALLHQDINPQPIYPKINERSSSLTPGPTVKNMIPAFPRPGRRQAPMKHSAHGSVQSVHQRPPSRGSLTSIPETSLSAPKGHLLRTSLQPTPPLSPANMAFADESHYPLGPVDSRSSVRSMRSVGAGSVSSKVDASDMDGANSGRFMAVTRQEEMLLAALRHKRAQIRESILAELEEEQGRSSVDLSQFPTRQSNGQMSSMSRHSSRSTIRALESQSSRPQMLVSKGSRSSLRSEQGRRLADIDDKGSDRGQILLMLDRPTGDIDPLDTAEPSPDLSDFLDFDDSSEGYHTRPISDRSDTDGRSMASLSGPSSRSASRSTLGHGRGRASLSAMAPAPSRLDTTQRTLKGHHQVERTPLSPSTLVAQLTGDDHVRIMDDAFGDMGFPEVPRPDSPISPAEGNLTMVPTTTKSKRKEVRLSAVGQMMPNMEVGWWDDDG